MIPTFTRAYEASAAIEPHRIVRFSDASASQKIATATANDQPTIGVSDRMGGKAGGMVDVDRGGLVSVQFGEAVQAGDPLTSDDEGKAVKAVPTAGKTVRVIGYADQPAAEDEIGDMFFAPGVIHLPAGGG